MKYDRPVWQLMHACADAMGATFRYEDVRGWFRENYPEIGGATLRAHVVGLTEGGAKHPQFQRRSPVFRRVARGVYEPIPFEERGELPEDSPFDEGAPVRFGRIGPAPEPATASPDEGDELDDDELDEHDLTPADATAETFWPFPEKSPHDDAMANAAAARQRQREKDERRRRKAAKREAKRRAEPQRTADADTSDDEPAGRQIRSETGAQRDRAAAEQDVVARRTRELDEARRVARQEALEHTRELDRAKNEAQQGVEDERRRLAAEREKLERVAVLGDVPAREQDSDVDRIRRDAERQAEQMAAVRLEAERAAAAQAEAGRLQAERVEAERVARGERKRANKLRKSARKQREVAEALERERIERKARRKAERRARENADLHLREAADRRRRDEQESERAAMLVRDDLDRLGRQALARIEAERTRSDTERAGEEQHERAEHDREGFERAEQERRAFEREDAEREDAERRRLEHEEAQHELTLRPMLDRDESRAAPVPDDTFEDPDGRPTDDEQQSGRFASAGGVVIVRAPRPGAAQASETPDAAAPQPLPAAEGGVPGASRGDDTDDGDHADEPDGESVSDAIVLGSLGERLRVPAPARDAYRDIDFQRARRDAERSGARWFVLSAEHGLLEPMEWMSPDERTMEDIEPRRRTAWATWVVARLESLVGDLAGQVIEVDAPELIAAPVTVAMEAAGAVVIGAQSQHVGSAATDDTVQPDQLESHDGPDASADDEDELPDAQVIPFARSGAAHEVLADPRRAVPAPAAATLPQQPGLYAWTVDHAGSRDLNRALRLPVGAGVIYVGQVGGTTTASEAASTLRDHVTRVQLHGRARASTFRMTLASALAGHLGLQSTEDPRLTAWMLQHLSVAVWPTADATQLQDLTASVVDELAPALNVDRAHSAEYRDRIVELTGRLA